MIFNLSKNAPCPCSSGKKYKLCCMGNLSPEHENYYGLLHKEQIIKDKLLHWVHENFETEDLNEYSLEFNNKQFNEINGDEDVVNFFDWFFLESFHKSEGRRMIELIRDDFSGLFHFDELPIVDEWIKNTQAGIFEVEKISKENWRLVLKEIFTQKSCEITDKKASEFFIKNDVLFARVQKIFSNFYMSGAGMNYSRFFAFDELKEFVMHEYNIEKQKNPNLTYEQFMNLNSRILNEFKPKEPSFITAGGDEIKFCDAAYSVDLSRIEKILDWFDESKDFIITDEEYRRKKFKSANIAFVGKNKEAIGESSERRLMIFCDYIDEFGNKIRSDASIDIEDNELKIFTQSEKVFVKLKKILDRNIGKFIKLKKESIKAAEEALAEDDEKDNKKYKKDNSFLAIEKEIMNQHYREWCYQKIPALGNNTPKEAIKTKEGRDMINKLLADFENHEQHKKREEGKYIPVEKIIRKELNFYEE